MKYRNLFLAAPLTLLLLGAGGCASTAQFVAQTAASLSHATPDQVTTLAQAELTATLIANASDVAVKTGKLDRATLMEIGALNAAIHAAVNSLEAAQVRGESLTYDSFNAALAAWNAYSTAKGIKS